MAFSNLIEAIGHTPLVRLQPEEGQGQLYAKLEMQNLYGMKDRVAKRTILEARRKGVLRPGVPIIESSSGTMALGVATVGTYLGHDVHIVTDPRIDGITLCKLKALGVHVHIVEKMTGNGWQSARLEKLAELMGEYPGSFWPQQYENPDNPGSYAELSDEIRADLGTFDYLVGAVGSGGSLCGSARAIRTWNPQVKVIAVDAVGSILFGQPDRPGRLQSGLGNSITPKNLDLAQIDEVHWLNDEEAFSATLELARREKIFAGNSSGSVYAVASWLSRHIPASERIVAIFPDRGDRYFNSIFSDQYRENHNLAYRVPKEPTPVQKTDVVHSWSYASLSGRESHAEPVAIP